MFSKDLAPLGILDRIKLYNGKEALVDYFHNLSLSNTENAINLINDANLHFPTLFILRSYIKKFNFSHHLNSKNKYTLMLINEILEKKSMSFQQLSPSNRDMTYSILKWILETGFRDDGLNIQYDELLDLVVLLLIKVFKDKTYLHLIAEMIFSRYKRNSFNYDLIWAFFECQDPKFLFHIANRLNSMEWKDIELSRKLLKFIPGMDSIFVRSNVQQQQFVSRWLQDNYLFLNYTGETFQQTCNPKPYELSLEAKYLCKPVAGDKEKMYRSLTGKEQEVLKKFKDLPVDTKLQLSNYSYLIYRQNKEWWNMWIRYPVEKQLNYIKYAGGSQ